jgi:hypothetical protein
MIMNHMPYMRAYMIRCADIFPNFCARHVREEDMSLLLIVQELSYFFILIIILGNFRNFVGLIFLVSKNVGELRSGYQLLTANT